MDYVIDGMDMREELDRLLDLVAWAGVDMHNPPVKLTIRRMNRRPNTLGTARWMQSKINMNTFAGQSKYDAMEVLIHELAHIYAGRRYDANGSREAHGPRFWRHLDAAFQEAYGPLTVAPRTNRYHGRYADALKRQALEAEAAALTARMDEVIDTPPVTVPSTEDLLPADLRPTRGSIGAENLPEPLRSWELKGEPRFPISHWLNGRDEVGNVVGRPIAGARQAEPTGKRTKTHVTDQRVLDLITARPGITRERVDRAYATAWDAYPGKNSYNSIWRLHKAGKVYKVGNRWYPSR